jgi:hypothetical protein
MHFDVQFMCFEMDLSCPTQPKTDKNQISANVAILFQYK